MVGENVSILNRPIISGNDLQLQFIRFGTNRRRRRGGGSTSSASGTTSIVGVIVLFLLTGHNHRQKGYPVGIQGNDAGGDAIQFPCHGTKDGSTHRNGGTFSLSGCFLDCHLHQTISPGQQQFIRGFKGQPGSKLPRPDGGIQSRSSSRRTINVGNTGETFNVQQFDAGRICPGH